MSDLSLVLVTGASKGIGRAIAIRLASKDTLVVCISKSDQDGLLETSNAIKDKGYFAHPILCDVSDYKNVSQMFEEIRLLKHPVRILINNAGISQVKLFTDTSYDDWQHVMNTNLTSVYNMCSFCVPDMVSEKNGHILNISSIWGNDGASMEVAYSASKGGVNSFTKALAKELGPSNIRVNAIACGVIDTGMNAFLTKEEHEELANSMSMSRYGTPDEVAEFAYALIKHSPYLTGQVITYDGGM
jgi:3-oxoacyl-[acyl-carrier protein] reductase